MYCMFTTLSSEALPLRQRNHLPADRIDKVQGSKCVVLHKTEQNNYWNNLSLQSITVNMYMYMCGVHKIIYEDKTSNHAFEEQRNKQSNSENKDIIVSNRI